MFTMSICSHWFVGRTLIVQVKWFSVII